MINRETIDLKNLHQLRGSKTMITQKKALGTLSATMMLALFIYSLYHTNGFLTYLFSKSPRAATPQDGKKYMLYRNF